MNKKKAHPLANAQDNRLDILYGTSEEETLNETLRIAREALPTLGKAENILYLNSLVSCRKFADSLTRICGSSRYFRRLIPASFAGKRLIAKLLMLENIVVQERVKLVIINCFDDTAFNSRHRMEVMEFIKWLRDTEEVRVVLCMRQMPRNIGAQATLMSMAKSVEEIGSYERDELSVGNEREIETIDDAPQTLEDLQDMEVWHNEIADAITDYDGRHDHDAVRFSRMREAIEREARPKTPIETSHLLENKDLALENV